MWFFWSSDFYGYLWLVFLERQEPTGKLFNIIIGELGTLWIVIHPGQSEHLIATHGRVIEDVRKGKLRLPTSWQRWYYGSRSHWCSPSSRKPGTRAWAQWLLTINPTMVSYAHKRLQGKGQFITDFRLDFTLLLEVSIHSNLCNFIITLISPPRDLQGGPPPVVSWFINPINWYIYHKP